MTSKKKLSQEEFTKQREALIEQLKAAIGRRDKLAQQAIRRQLLSDDLVP
jgi:hypothetical protein